MQLFIQRVYTRDCDLNNNGVIYPDTHALSLPMDAMIRCNDTKYLRTGT